MPGGTKRWVGCRATASAGGIDALQLVHARGHEVGQATTSTAHVETLDIGWQLLPGKHQEVVVKQPLSFCGLHSLLIEEVQLIT